MTKTQAHNLLNAAVSRGQVSRGACEICGATSSGRRAIDGHHRFGYDRPLDVVWLCRTHHFAEHRTGPGLQTRANVREQLALGKTQSETARVLGISRQRVHQVVRAILEPSA